MVVCLRIYIRPLRTCPSFPYVAIALTGVPSPIVLSPRSPRISNPLTIVGAPVQRLESLPQRPLVHRRPCHQLFPSRVLPRALHLGQAHHACLHRPARRDGLCHQRASRIQCHDVHPRILLIVAWAWTDPCAYRYDDPPRKNRLEVFWIRLVRICVRVTVCTCSCALFRCDGSKSDMIQTPATSIPLHHDVPLAGVHVLS